MFITLTVCNLKRKTTTEKLHLVKKRRFVTEYTVYDSGEFYTTRLFTYCSNNEKAINKYFKNIDFPLITKSSEIVVKFFYITLANTAFKNMGGSVETAIYDPDGHFIFLLPNIFENSRSINICTLNFQKYETACQNIYKQSGTPYIISSNPEIIKNCDIILCESPPPIFTKGKIFSKKDFLNKKLFMPNFLSEAVPDYAEPLIIAAGLYFTNQDSRLGSLYFET